MDNKRELKGKMQDYDTFGKILLAVSAMMLLGIVVASEGKSNAQVIIMIGTVIVSISGAAVFFWKSIKIQNKYYEC